MTNADIAKTLQEIASLLDMQGIPSPRAYEKAAHAIKIIDLSVEEIYRRDGLEGLKEISNIGASIAVKIATLIETGRLRIWKNCGKKSGRSRTSFCHRRTRTENDQHPSRTARDSNH